jgi:ribonuclease J
MQQVANAAIRHHRKLAFAGTSMVENAKMARKLGYLEIPDEILVSIDQALKMNPKEVALMTTGTQGEPTSIMGRLSTGTNRQFESPGHHRALLAPIRARKASLHINRLFRRGASVIYENIAPVHVSGHASQEEMKLLLHLVRPKYFIPIHGELRHLKQHANIARQVGIPDENIAVIENGQVVEFKDGEMSLGERLPGGYIFVDGAGVGDVGPTVMREREALARDGFVLVNLTIDSKTKRLREDPEIITRGFIYTGNGDDLMDATRKLVKDVIKRGDVDLEADLEPTIKSFLYNKTRRRPMIFGNNQPALNKFTERPHRPSWRPGQDSENLRCSSLDSFIFSSPVHPPGDESHRDHQLLVKVRSFWRQRSGVSRSPLRGSPADRLL